MSLHDSHARALGIQVARGDRRNLIPPKCANYQAGSMVDLIGQKPDVVEPLRIQDPRRYFDAGSTHPEAITQAPMKCVAQGTLFDM